MIAWELYTSEQQAMETLIDNQPYIITLDVDEFLFERLQKISQAGFAVAEINSVDEHVLGNVLKKFPQLKIGAGNIIDIQQLETCYQANVHFITSPGFLPALAQTANIYSIKYLPGIATISEAMQAMSFGCYHVRPYPASLAFCSALNKCLPKLRLYPAEIEWEEAEHFFNLPSVAAVSLLNPEYTQLTSLETA
ncbi:bifunctional 4-hydroxy-2-oxoglutarate aldolase/2-dehydro-3-deoxy-phosphogluconate aldolase [Legionella londiniensis]|uniref:Keto-hydroxyglutarate aldolase n=1 Tax=Legionella londiniensis TaxID=45068 RepID=A0A0W0VQL3_9GAMM|nr:bifunctional 4-hydroxy-2-oxoglutarate aldolase/2-dehydro-3-deoxy-phosphogluconate aldolase [Legionella londiniensis]KTD22412.1 keto-hydroxyglutarate aldolase [Legionella londiniensis]STX93014.1 keto-hydroxyglutarate aldolase [Legionella londiniensis]